MDSQDTTIVKIFQDRVRGNGDTPFVKFHDGNEWQEMSWRVYGERVKLIGCGLIELGVSRGDGICIMSNTRYEWGMIDLAILSIGGVTGAIYPTLLAKDTAFIIKNMNARYVFVEGPVQRDVVLSGKVSLPQLKKVIVINNDAGSDPLCMPLQALIDSGKSLEKVHENKFYQMVDSIKPADDATIIHTSGTTGDPKGALHDHASIVYTAFNNVYPFEPGMTDLSYLPMAHVFERFGGFFALLNMGNVKIGYSRGDMKLLVSDFAEIKPHVNRTAPRLLEKIYSMFVSGAAAKGPEAVKAFEHSLSVAKAVRVDQALFGIDPGEKALQEFEQVMKNDPFAFLHLVLGGNMKFFYGGGAAIPKEVTEFFWAAGIPVYELYGTTETIGTITNYPGKVKPGTVGVPFPMTGWKGEPGKTRLAADGEIENFGPNVMKCYFNDPEATKEAFTADGWYKTGDIGAMDKDGFISITGRKKDIIVTSGGKNIAPQRIEGHFKNSGYFSQVVIYGDNCKYLTALLTLEPTMIATIALKLAIDLTQEAGDEEKYGRVAGDPRTYTFIQSIVDNLNSGLFKQEQIIKFVLLERDLKAELDEITPTMKTRKNVVLKRFKDRLDGLYD